MIIIMARKPMSGTVIGCLMIHGTGAININKARIGDETFTVVIRKRPATGIYGFNSGKYIQKAEGTEYETPPGRWPPNLILEHTSECCRLSDEKWECQSGCPAKEFGRTLKQVQA